jgi:uncharacterized protein (TIRG00374 family)
MKLRTALVTLLAIALFAWFLRNSNPADILRHVRSARIDYLVLAFVFVAIPYWLRAIRWQCLLAPIGKTSFRNVFRAMVLGFAALALLPGRVGDVLRPYLIARQEGLPLPATMATVVMERVLDLVAVLSLLAIFVINTDEASFAPGLLQPIKVSAMIAAGAAVALLIMMWVLATHPERIGGLVRTLHRVMPHRIADRLGDLASTFSAGFAAARRPRDLGMAVLWSFPIWIAFSAETWAVSKALSVDLPWSASFLLQAMLVIGVAVPTPGGVGSFHAMYQFGATTFFGADPQAAVAAAIVLHAMSFVPISIAGLLIMANEGLSFGRLRQLSQTPSERGATP